MWELLVIWDDGKKECHSYMNETKAREAESGYLMAFGNQIQYTSVYRRLNK